MGDLASPLHLQPDDLHILRYYLAVTRILCLVLHQIFVLLRPQNNLSIRDLVFNLPGYSNDRYRSDFYSSERQKLDNNDLSETFDVTLLYKLLQLVCGLPDRNNPCWLLSGSFENQLKLLKDIRNELSHKKDLMLTALELEQKGLYMKTLCQKALEAAGQRSGQDVTTLVSAIESNMENVLVGNIDFWEPYRQGLEELRQEKYNVIVREGKEEIKSLAHKLQILNPFSWVLEAKYAHLNVNQIFTKMKLGGEKQVDFEDMLVTPLSSGELPNCIILSGSPGMGKTSLARFLVHDWLSAPPSVQGLENVHLLIPVELRHVTSLCLDKLIREELLPNSCRQLQHDEIIPILQEVDILWLLDGYDEANGATKKIVKEILCKFSNAKIIVTTRTEFKPELESQVDAYHQCSLILEMTGFSFDDVKDCSLKIFKTYIQDPDDLQSSFANFMEYVDGRQISINELVRVPLFLALLAVLWLDSPAEITEATTRTKLYMLLVDRIVNRMIVREKFQDLPFRIRKRKEKVDAFLNILGEVLWREDNFFGLGLSDSSVTQLEDKCKELQIPFEETMSPFFSFSERRTQAGISEIYIIIHRTLNEFLSAKAFCNTMISNKWDILTTINNWMQKRYTPEELENMNDMVRANLMWSIDVFQDIPDVKYFGTLNICHFCFGSYLLDLEEERVARTQIRFDKETSVESCFFAINNLGTRDDVIGLFMKYISVFTMSFIAGFLRVSDELTVDRIKQILYITQHERWHEFFILLVQESERDDRVISEMAAYCKLWYWQPRVSKADDVLIITQNMIPGIIDLHVCDYGIKSHQLIEYVNIFAALPTEIHIDFRSCLDSPIINLVEDNLRVITAEASQCHLTALCCPVNKCCLNMIRKVQHLEDLCVRVHSSEELYTLANIVSELHLLKSLMISMTPDIYMGQALPRFNFRDDDLDIIHYLWVNGQSWNLPSIHCKSDCSGTNCHNQIYCNTCHPTPSFWPQLKLEKSPSSIRYHRKSIIKIKSISRIIRGMLSFAKCTERSCGRNSNLSAGEESNHNATLYQMCLKVCQLAIRQHNTCLRLHQSNAVVHCVPSCTPNMLPVTLKFTDVFKAAPEQVGVAVRKLCTAPTSVILWGEPSNISCEYLASFLYHVACAVDKIQNVRLIIKAENMKSGAAHLFLFQMESKLKYDMKCLFPDITWEIRSVYKNEVYTI